MKRAIQTNKNKIFNHKGFPTLRQNLANFCLTNGWNLVDNVHSSLAFSSLPLSLHRSRQSNLKLCQTLGS